MKTELFLSSGPGEIRAALAEDGSIVDLQVARDSQPGLLDAIFLARVTRVVAAIPGVFLDLGNSVSAFLPGERRPGAALPTEGSALVVQVVKEAHGDKQPEVTTALSIQATHLVWTPLRPGIAVSRQIPPEERARLSAILKEIVLDGEGAVIRTHGSGALKASLIVDAEFGRTQYAALLRRSKSLQPPARLDAVTSLAASVVSRLQGTKLDRIVVNDASLAAELCGAQAELLVDKAGQRFADIGFDDAFDAAVSRTVALPGLARLVFDMTEAVTIIDVNLGAAARGRAAQAILDANRAAAVEIARQLRLRNLSGAIIIDFISMRMRAHRDLVETVFKEAASRDQAPVEFHGWTRLGHLELTRRRQGVSIAEALLEPLCEPRKAARTVAYEVLRAISRASLPPEPIEVLLNPKVIDLLKGDLAPLVEQAIRLGGRRIILKSDPGRALETFEIGPATSSTNK